MAPLPTCLELVKLEFAFGNLVIHVIFSNNGISTRLHSRPYGTLELPIAFYGAESWILPTQETQFLEGYYRCHQGTQIAKYRYQRRQIYLWIHDICQQIQKTPVVWARLGTFGHVWARLGTFGHVCRIPRDNIVIEVFKQDCKRHRKRGSPLKRWHGQIRNDEN